METGEKEEGEGKMQNVKWKLKNLKNKLRRRRYNVL